MKTTMKTSKLIGYGRKILKGNRRNGFAVSFALLGTVMFFRLVEAAVALFMIYYVGIKPGELFSLNNYVWQGFVLTCTLLKYIVLAPLLPAAAYWFTEICDTGTDVAITSGLDFFTKPRLLFKSFFTLILMKTISLIFLIPAAFFGLLSYNLVKSGADSHMLFYATHSVSMTAVSIWIWLWAVSGMLAVPFVMLKDRQKNAFSIVFASFKLMHRRRKQLAFIALLLLLPMFLIVTIPFMLPAFFMAVSLYINVTIKEAEYYNTQSNGGETCNASEFSKKPGRIKETADTA